MLETDYAARCECALHPRGGEQVQRSAALSVLSIDLSSERRRESGRIPPSVRPSLLLPQIHAAHPVKLDLCPDSLGARETDGQTGSDCCCPRKFAKWILSTPAGSLDGRAAKRHVNRTSGFSLSQGQLLLALAPLAEGGRGANTHTYRRHLLLGTEMSCGKATQCLTPLS